MATDPKAQIEHWKKVEGHEHSRIIAYKLTYNEAAARVRHEVYARGCRQSPRVGYQNGRIWSVYYVSGGQ